MYFNTTHDHGYRPDQPFVSKYSLGNLGYVRQGCRTQFVGQEAICARTNAEEGNDDCSAAFDLSCRDPNVVMTGVVFAGVKPYRPDLQDLGFGEFGNDFCGDPASLAGQDDCRWMLDQERLDAGFAAECLHRSNCVFNMWDYVKEGTDADRARSPYCQDVLSYIYL